MAIAGLERFRPNTDRPAEFLKFWALAVAELQELAPRPLVCSRETPEPGLRLEQVRFESLQGASISTYLLRPDTGRPCPLVVHAHGCNDRYEVMLEWARSGCNVFGFDARGFGRPADTLEISPHGYVLTGIESPETCILRGAVADFLQALAAARELLEGQLTTVNFYGFSIGGGLALMAAALSRDPDFLVLGQPTFGWSAERRRVSNAGSSKEINDYVAAFPWRREIVDATLRYLDTLNFASLVKVPTLVGIGLDDNVVPSRTVLAIVNHKVCAIEVRLLPVSHSADPRESLWTEFHAEWLGYVVDGLPPDFGTQNRQIRALVA